MNSLIALLCIIINSSFTKDTDYRIALFVIEHLYDIHKYTLNEMAEKCYTSVPTLKKFFRMLGDKDFSMFRFHINNSISVRTGQMSTRNIAGKYQETEKLIQRFYPSLDLAHLKKTVQTINERISSLNRVVILGAAYPNALAVNYQEDMIIMQKPVITEPAISSLTNDFDEIREDDFVILTTISGSFFSIYPKRHEEVAKLKNIAIITSESTDLSAFPDAIDVRIPVSVDDELYNYFLMSFFQLLKTDYYQNYSLSKN